MSQGGIIGINCFMVLDAIMIKQAIGMCRIRKGRIFNTTKGKGTETTP